MLELFGKRKSKNILVLSLLIFSSLLVYVTNALPKKVRVSKNIRLESTVGDVKIPKSIIMYDCIEKYSNIYEIPKYIAYNVAYKETRYKGPFDWGYNPERISFVGALGPMQIMPSTGRSYYNKIMGFKGTLSNDKLLTDIETNVMLSMKILRRTYDRVGNWSIACGEYNTGRPIINEYATYCSSNKDYKSKWVKY